MTKQTHVTLQATEGYIVMAAANIYSAYIAVGKVESGDEDAWIKRSIQEAIRIAKLTDNAIIAEGEMTGG